MTAGTFRFDTFLLDPADRRLTRNGVPVELNARYLDALALLVREGGALVSKARFMDEVWRGVPVTDEALTQCIRTLRRTLGDDATRPRFIKTVPKHGYRFVAAIDAREPEDSGEAPPAARPGDMATLTGAGAVGGAAAGAVGGVLYGFTFESGSVQPGTGAASMLIVLLVVCALVGAAGGAGVGGGIAVARRLSGQPWRWAAIGGAAGGLTVGAVGKLLGLDAFALLLGRSPGNIAGGVEGLVLGVAVGLGGWLGGKLRGGWRMRVAAAGVTGVLAGVVIGASGGRLMAGSLDQMARGFAGSRLQMGQIGRLFGESGFGPVTLTVTTGLESLLFASAVVAALTLAERRLPARTE